MKAIIIGGGVGGLCTALALQNNAIDIAVYEKSQEARADGAGLVLWPNAVRAIRQLGAEPILADCYSGNIGAIHRSDGLTLSKLDAQTLEQRYGAPIIAVHREELMRGILTKLNASVNYGKQVASYQQDAASITAYFTDGSSDTADVLIGADGIGSAIRKQMQPQAQPSYQGYAAWRGVVTFPHTRVGTMWGETWGRGARFGIVPLSRDRVYWFATANRPAKTPPADHKATLRTLFSTWHSPIAALIDETPISAILYNDISDLQPLASWVDGRAALLGDAAHATTPNMGQGACQAIEDALILGQSIQQQPNPTAALQAYQNKRISHTRKVVLRSRNIGRMGQLENKLLIALRNALVRVTPEWMSAQQFDFVLASNRD